MHFYGAAVKIKLREVKLFSHMNWEAKTDKRTIFYKELADKQIFKVKHILNNDRKFNELQIQYEIPSKFWFSWQKIVSPDNWRKILNRNIDVNQTDDLCIYINKKCVQLDP